jgi:hypothetical protein
MGAPTRPHSRNLFATIGAMDVATLGSLFTREARVVFGNGAPMVDNDEIGTGTTAFFDTIADLHHAIVKQWSVGDDSIIDLRVTYGRKDGQQIAISCVTIFHTNTTAAIDDYRVCFDLAPVYA